MHVTTTSNQSQGASDRMKILENSSSICIIKIRRVEGQLKQQDLKYM